MRRFLTSVQLETIINQTEKQTTKKARLVLTMIQPLHVPQTPTSNDGKISLSSVFYLLDMNTWQTSHGKE